MTDTIEAAPTGPIKKPGLWSRLYNGQTDFNIVGRWKLWVLLSGLVIVASLGSLAVRGLDLGIDFTGGTVWEVPAGDADVSEVGPAMAALGYRDVQIQETTMAEGGSLTRFFRVEAEATASPEPETTEALDGLASALDELADDAEGTLARDLRGVTTRVQDLQGPFEDAVPAPLTALRDEADGFAELDDEAAADAVATMRTLSEELEVLQQAEQERLGAAVTERLSEITGSPISEITIDRVGPSWGQQITEKARTALIAFLVSIMAYITLRFEFKMAIATIAALVHDLIVVVGMYSIFGFTVTPATVIALLTILGFSIYDGIVVFDRVDENSGLASRKGKMTYTEMANLSLNQVLMRSLNTSITALLPILSILVVGSLILGEATLQEFGIALFLGVMAGAYSSLYIATPLLALLKEREPKYREVREELEGRSRSERDEAAAPAGPLATAGATVSGGADPITPRPRKQGRRR